MDYSIHDAIEAGFLSFLLSGLLVRIELPGDNGGMAFHNSRFFWLYYITMSFQME